jgi:hypothetical protein
MATLLTKPDGSSFDQDYQLKSIIGCSNLDFSKVAEDGREAAARQMMLPLLNLTDSDYTKRGSSLMLRDVKAGTSSSRVSPVFNNAFKGTMKEHAKKKLAWPTVLLHMQRRPNPLPSGNKGFLRELETTPLPLGRLPLPQQQQQQQQQQQGEEGLVPVHLHPGGKPLTITLERLAPWEMFSHRNSLLEEGGAEYGGSSKYGLWYAVSRCGKGPHSTNDLANRSLLGSKDGVRTPPIAINSEEQLVDAGYQQAYRDALTLPASLAGKFRSSSNSGNSSSSSCVEEQDIDWTVLTGFLGNNQPLMDRHDINKPFLQDVAVMYLAVGATNSNWWKDAPKAKSIPSTVPQHAGGTAEAIPEELVERFKKHHKELVGGTSSSSSSSSSRRRGGGGAQPGAAGVLANSKDLTTELPQLYEAFLEFWECKGPKEEQQQLRDEARGKFRVWLHRYLRRVVTAAVTDTP